MKIKFKKLHENATLPTVARDGDVGHDLRAVEDVMLRAKTVTKVKTGVCLASYNPCVHVEMFQYLTIYPEIKSRSGLASEGIIAVGGIVDPGYRGEIIALLLNTTDTDRAMASGDKCAQIVFTACLTSPMLKIEEDNVVEQTERGDSGFGSSGR